jgi:excisionase family DNA binding protein
MVLVVLHAGVRHWEICSLQSDATERLTLERMLAVVSTTEATARLGVSRGYLSRLARAGQIPVLRPGTDHYYVPADVVLPDRTCQQCGTSLAGLAKNRVYCDRCPAERRGTEARS